MCRSVPQIEATLTRTNTSFAPISGRGTSRISTPAAAVGFTTAVIVFGIQGPSGTGHYTRIVTQRALRNRRVYRDEMPNLRSDYECQLPFISLQKMYDPDRNDNQVVILLSKGADLCFIGNEYAKLRQSKSIAL